LAKKKIETESQTKSKKQNIKIKTQKNEIVKNQNVKVVRYSLLVVFAAM